MSGPSLRVTGFQPADEKWEKMAKAYRACLDAGVGVPREVTNFFNSSDPDGPGREISHAELEKLGAVWQYTAEMVDGFKVDIDRLPKNVKFLRFTASY